MAPTVKPEPADDLDSLYQQYGAKAALADTGDDLDKLASQWGGTKNPAAPDLSPPGPYAQQVEQMFRERSTAKPPVAAARDVSVTPATAPEKYVAAEHPVIGGAAEALAAPFAHPAETIAGIAMVFPQAADVLGRRLANSVPNAQLRSTRPLPPNPTDKEVAIAAAQVASSTLAPEVKATVAKLAEPLLGEAGGALAGGIAAGAAPGAAFMPEHPLIGATIGGTLGAIDAAAAYRPRVAAPTGANLAEHPERLLTERSAAVPGRASVAPEAELPAEEAPYTTESVGDTLDKLAKEYGARPKAPVATPVPEPEPTVSAIPREPTIEPRPTPEPQAAPPVSQPVSRETPSVRAPETPPGGINPDSRYADETNPESFLEGARRQAAEHEQAARFALGTIANMEKAKGGITDERRKELEAEAAQQRHLYEATLSEIGDSFGHDVAEQMRARIESDDWKVREYGSAEAYDQYIDAMHKEQADEYRQLIAENGPGSVRPPNHMVNSLDDAIQYAAYNSQGAQKAWYDLRQRGATDDEIAQTLKPILGTMSGSSVGGYGTPAGHVETRPGKVTYSTYAPPKNPDDETEPVETIDQTVSGKKLIAAARRILNIPKPGAAPVAAPQGQPLPAAAPPKQQAPTTVPPRNFPTADLGSMNEVRLSDGRRIGARYALVSLDDVVGSHNPITFEPNPEMPRGVQGRAYHGTRGEAARQSVAGNAANLDAGILLDRGASAATGPSLIQRDGYGVAGFGRLMAEQRAAELHPEKYQEYVARMAAEASQFGLDPKKVATTPHPAIVRILADPRINDRSVAELGEINRVSDIPETKAKDAASEGASRAQALMQAPESLAHLVNTLGPDDTISEYLTSAAGGQFVRGLVRDGVIAQQEAGRFIDPRTGTVTGDGREIIKNTLYATAVQDPDVVDRAPKSIRQKIEHAIPAIVQANLTPGYELADVLAQALDLTHVARANGVTVQQHLTGGLFPPPEVDPVVAAMARLLEAGNKAQVAERFRRYAQMAREAAGTHETADMFAYTPPPREEFLNRVFIPDLRVAEERAPYHADDEARQFMSDLSRGQAATNPDFRARATETLANVLHPTSAPIRSRPIPSDAPWITSKPFDPSYKEHADFAAAKAGDPEAAVRFVTAQVSPDTIIEAKRRFGPDVIYAAPHAMEALGPNAIPSTLAQLYADATGARVGLGILQANRVHHTGADMMERLVSKPEFVGPVEAGGRYVLVDDVITSGGTLAGMADYIQQQGGRVVGIVGLANGAREGQFGMARPQLIRNLEKRGLGDAIRETLGVEPAALTAGEAGYLIGFRTPDELRARAARAVAAQRGRLRPQSVPAPRPDLAAGEGNAGPQAGTGGVGGLGVATQHAPWLARDVNGRPMAEIGGAPPVHTGLTPQQEQAGRRFIEKVKGVGLQMAGRRRAEILAAARNDLIDPVGRVVPNPRDLALLMRAFRHPSIEIFGAFVRRQPTGEVIGHRMMTSGAVWRAVPTVQMAQDVMRLVQNPTTDEVVLHHNHPDGLVVFSEQDHTAMQEWHDLLSRWGIRLAGHILINHGVARWLAWPDRAERTIIIPAGNPAWRTAWAAGFPHPTSSGELAAYLREITDPHTPVAALMDSQNGIVGIAPVLPAALLHIKQWLPRMLAEAGAEMVAFGGPDHVMRPLARMVGRTVANPGDWPYAIRDILGLTFSANGTPLDKYISYAAHGIIPGAARPEGTVPRAVDLRPGLPATTQIGLADFMARLPALPPFAAGAPGLRHPAGAVPARGRPADTGGATGTEPLANASPPPPRLGVASEPVGTGVYGRRFYSRLERAIEQAPFDKGTVEQWRAQLSKNVAKGEREWTKIEAAFDRLEPHMGAEPISKKYLLRRFAESRVQLAERGAETAKDREQYAKRLREAMYGLTSLIADRVNPPLDRFLAADIAHRVVQSNAGPTAERMAAESVDFELQRDRHGGEQLGAVRDWTPEERQRFDELWRTAKEADRAELDIDEDRPRYEQYTEPGGTNYREIRIMLDRPNEREPYTTSHFPSDRDVVAHVRVKDRIDPDGKKTLFVEEMQSDWHQVGRRRGYRTPEGDAEAREQAIQEHEARAAQLRAQIREAETAAPPTPPTLADAKQYFGIDDDVWVRISDADRQSYLDEMIERHGPTQDAVINSLHRALRSQTAAIEAIRSGSRSVPSGGVPNAPMKKTEEWAGLVVKRLLAEAVEGGYGRIAWTTGDQQARRYDLSKHVDKLEYNSATGQLEAFKGGRVVHEGKYDARALPDVIGKDVADRLLASPATESGSMQQLRARGEPVGVVPKVWDAATQTHVEVSHLRPSDVNYGARWHIRYANGEDYGSYLSREAAEREAEMHREMLRRPLTTHVIGGENLRVGGQGMKGFYDKIVPGLFRDEGKKIGVKVDIERVPLTGRRPVATEYQVDGLYGRVGIFNDLSDAQAFREREGSSAPIRTVRLADLHHQEVRELSQRLWSRGYQRESDIIGEVADLMAEDGADWKSAFADVDREHDLPNEMRNEAYHSLARFSEEVASRPPRQDQLNESVVITPELRHAIETKGLAVWAKKARYEATPDLFGNETPMEGQPAPPEMSPQESLFGGNAGTVESRNLAETERAARAELAQLEQREQLTTSPIEQLKIARRKAELQKLVNRGEKIGASELATRVRAEAEPERPLPPRTADTMSDAIALSSPNGRMSQRAKKAATDRLAESLFGPGGATREQIMGGPTPQPTERERLLTQAKRLRDLAAGGMSVRKYTKEAERLEAEAAKLNDEGGLFGGGGVRQPPAPPYNAGSGYGHLPMPEPGGFAQARAHIRPFELMRKLRAIFNPESLGAEPKGTGGNIRHESAVRFRAYAQAEHALDGLKKYVDKQDRETQVAWWDAYERGIPSGDPYVDAANKVFAEVTEARTAQLIRMGRLDARRAIENYIGRFWSAGKPEADPKAVAFARTIVGRRPFEGPKSFLKERSFEHFTEGLQAGLVPATYNYVESQLAKIAEMERLIGADHMLSMEQAAGRAKPIMDASAGAQPPVDGEGRPWVKIDRDGNDPAFTIWGPRTVEHFEGVDAMVYGKLKRLMDDLNIRFKRPVNIGGERLGYAQAPSQIVTKFAGPMGTVVHEIGHILDWKYGLGKRIEDAIGKAPTRTAQKGKRAGQQVPDYSKKGGDTAEMRERRKTLRDELRNLANLRMERLDTGVPETKDIPKGGGFGGRGYLHSTEEKMANMVDAYVTNPERMKQVAPGIYDIFDKIVGEHPELHPLRDIKPSLAREVHYASTELPGPMIVGHWYAPAESAAVWANHLSRGLRGNPWYDAVTAPGYGATQLLLGVSGFHGTVIATEGMFSDMVMAAEHAMKGDGKETARSLTQTVTTPVTTAISALSPRRAAKAANLAFGAKIMNEYRVPGSEPGLARVLDAMIAGGFRGTAKSELWTGERTQALKRAVGQAFRGDTALRKAWGASRVPLDTIFAGIELAAQPLMGKYVPLMKTAATYRAVAERLKELPPDLLETDPDRFHREMWDIVKEMDLRFGQVIYDNHFINRVAKDLAQAMFLAPGWTFGTLDLMTRGARDLAVAPKRAYDRARGKPGADEQPIVGKSGKYWIAAVIGTMLLNAILTKLATGTNPGSGNDGWKDFFAFRDGTKDRNGNANRHTIPGYLMHDVYGWTHHPVNTFLNKLSPFFAFGARVAQNRDFYGNMLYDPDTTGAAKAKELGTATVKEFAPLSVQNYLQGRERGEHGAGEMARNAFGVTPAKHEFVQTKAQNMIDEYLGRRPHEAQTPQEAAAAKGRRALRDSLQRGQTTLPHVIRLEIAGELTPGQGKSMIQTANKGALLSRFEQLKDAQKVRVYEAGEPWERVLWRIPYLQAAARLRLTHVMTAPPQ